MSYGPLGLNEASSNRSSADFFTAASTCGLGTVIAERAVCVSTKQRRTRKSNR